MHFRQRLYPMLLAIFAVSWLILFTAQTKADTQPSDLKIDKHALAATPEDETSFDSLAKYLAGPCKTERDKARAIFRWITDRIAYDMEAYIARKADSNPESALKRRKAVCGGYLKLYGELAKRLGLKVVEVNGHTRRMPNGSHGWLAVRIKDNWQLVEPTFGAGGFQDKKFIKQFSAFFFFPPPDQLLFSHLPDDPKWQLVKNHVSSKEFWRRPAVEWPLFDLGFTSGAVESAMASKKFRAFVDVSAHPSKATTIVKAPLEKYLVEGEDYEFTFRSEDYGEMTVFNNTTLVPMVKMAGKSFTAKVNPTKGTLMIGARMSEADRRYSVILAYVVESPTAGRAQRPSIRPSEPVKKESR